MGEEKKLQEEMGFMELSNGARKIQTDFFQQSGAGHDNT